MSRRQYKREPLDEAEVEREPSLSNAPASSGYAGSESAR